MPPIRETVRVHFKILADPATPSLNERFHLMKTLFESYGVGVEMGSYQRLNLPDLADLAVGECASGGALSTEQHSLFQHRDNVPLDDVCIYFVRTMDGYNGCAVHPQNRPGAVVAHDAPGWTLAHEVGHVLGLKHENNDRLLMHKSVARISVQTPGLTQENIKDMLAHSLTR